MVDHSPVLELLEVKKSFEIEGRRLEVLNGITLRVHGGEQVAVVGPSGAGKSTLLHIAGTILGPTSGWVKLEGKSLKDLADREISRIRNRLIGFVFQFHHLQPDLTALENVIVPLKIYGKLSGAEQVKRGQAWLERVGLRQRMNHLPGELSGGEQQRVAVARALVHDPLLVLADEPTGDLDRENGEHVFQLLKEMCLHRGAALVVVSHDPSIGRGCGRVIEMMDGRVVKESRGREG